MPVVLDSERIWLVTCEHHDCGRRTYMQAETKDEAADRAVRKVAWVRRGGKVWCPFHGRVSHG